MVDPYRSRGARQALTGAGEGRNQLGQFVQRLVELGATGDEVQAVVDTWDDLDPDGTPDGYTRRDRDLLVAQGDNELREQILAARREHRYATTTDQEAAAQARERAYQQALREAQDRIGGNVDAVVAWVGGDVVRAQAVRRLETGPDGASRKTLLAQLPEGD